VWALKTIQHQLSLIFKFFLPSPEIMLGLFRLLFATCTAEGGCATHAFLRPGFEAGFCILGVMALSLCASADFSTAAGKIRRGGHEEVLG
jgi:hypothetical protein